MNHVGPSGRRHGRRSPRDEPVEGRLLSCGRARCLRVDRI